MNIYSLYVTRSREEREYFFKVLGTLKKNVQIVHLDFKYTDVFHNMKFYRQPITAVKYTFTDGILTKKTSIIYDFDDLVRLYTRVPGKGIFVYSGHSDGMYFVKHNIRLLRIEDFCELISKVLGKKAEIIIFDCCLCGNIGCLSICRDYSHFVIASTSYWSYLSVLEINPLYSDTPDTLLLGKNVVNEMVHIEENTKNAYTTSFCLYEMNDSLNKLIDLVFKYKNSFNLKKSYVIEKSYYKDIECEFKENFNIDISSILKGFIRFQRFPLKKCRNNPVSKNANKSAVSSIIIILKRPIHEIPTKADIFLK
jgi:hypothetical protein